MQLRIVALLALSALAVGTRAESRQQSAAQQKEADYCALPSNSRPTLPAVLMAGQGNTNFPISTKSKEAQAFFNQGVDQVHSFWFKESERSFMQVLELDPDAVMAYWGIALSAAGDYRPAFQLMRNRSGQARPPMSPNEKRAWEAIQKGYALRDKASPKEQLYIESQYARRNPEAKDADAEYVAGLRKIVQQFPEDLEAKSMLALAIDRGFETPSQSPREGTMESIALLNEILRKDPNHVGAHHYMIHAMEGSKSPQDAWWSCQRYPELAPNIPHALHMPGHIYAQSGRMPDAVMAFSSAALNELKYISGDVLYPNGHWGHNHHFLIHTLGMMGKYQAAMARTSEMLQFKENPRERQSADGSSVYRQGWFTLLKNVVRFEKWDEILGGKTFFPYERPRELAWFHWARGLAHATTGNNAAAVNSLTAMRVEMKQIGSVPPALNVASIELEGYIDLKSGKSGSGLELLKKAVQMEDALIYTEPPAYPRPVRELLGKALLTSKDFKAAEDTYRQALAKEPTSGRAAWGLATALDGQGKKADAQKAWADFARWWGTADSDLPEMSRLRQRAPATENAPAPQAR